MECNGREAVTNFEPSTYEGEVNLVSNKQGTIGFRTSALLNFLFFLYFTKEEILC